MSVHALTLTSYNPKKVHSRLRVAQMVNNDKWHPESKSFGIPHSSMTTKPRIYPILVPEDELPRPAVIGLAGSYGPIDSAAAIKVILSSVLNKPISIKSIFPVNPPAQDCDNKKTEDRSSGGNKDTDNEPGGIPIIPGIQNDIRFNRHTAAWDNSQGGSPNTPPLDSLPSSHSAPVTSAYSVPKLEVYLKCNSCSEINSPGPLSLSPMAWHRNAYKRNRRFSSPSIASHLFNPSLQNPSLEQFTLNLNESAADSEASAVEDFRTFCRRSWSCSNFSKVTENSPTPIPEAPSTENLFAPTVNLEKENEHFLAADLFISLVETMKSNWQYEQWQTDGGMHWLKRETVETGFWRRQKSNSESATSVDSGLAIPQNSPVETILEEEEKEEEEEEEEEECSKSTSTSTSVSTSTSTSTSCEYYEDVYEDYVVIEMKASKKRSAKKGSGDMEERMDTAVSISAEDAARNLYRAFRQRWTQPDGDVQLPPKLPVQTVSCKNAIPEEFESSVSLVEEIKRRRMRDTEEWSPPRFQIITTVHPYLRRDAIIASQNYFCFGCGTKVEPRYTSRLRYCDYLGKYFCDCCHHYLESPIPSRIFSKWNFSKYHVSNFSRNLLDKIWEKHTFNVENENPALYTKVKDLNRVKEVQQQLIHISKLVMTCRFADSVVKEFRKFPSHLIRELHLFTLDDLDQIKQKTLLPDLRELLALAIAHVEECVLCSAKGFFCEFCKNPHVIYPFQIETCKRCEACKACYHKKCFNNVDCPKCLRIKAREALITDSPLTSSGEVE